MRTVARDRKQAIIRLDVDTMAWLSEQARNRGKSFNSFVTDILREEKEKAERLEKLRIPESISPEVMSLCGVIRPFTEEEISSDPRLRHILQK